MKIWQWFKKLFKKKKPMVIEDKDNVHNNAPKTNFANDINVFSENNYGKIFGNTKLDIKTINIKFRPKAMEMIELCKKEPGIYFYKKNGVIEYVGQSINVMKRTAEHLIDSEKEQAIDKELRSNLFEYELEVKYCNKEELNDLEEKYIKKYNPKHNHTKGGSNITSKSGWKSYTKDVGIKKDLVDINGHIFSYTGTFFDKENKRMNRNQMKNILVDLGGDYKKEAKSSTLWLIGRNPGGKQEKIDEDDIVVNSPFSIIGFEKKYKEWNKENEIIK